MDYMQQKQQTRKFCHQAGDVEDCEKVKNVENRHVKLRRGEDCMKFRDVGVRQRDFGDVVDYEIKETERHRDLGDLPELYVHEECAMQRNVRDVVNCDNINEEEIGYRDAEGLAEFEKKDEESESDYQDTEKIEGKLFKKIEEFETDNDMMMIRQRINSLKNLQFKIFDLQVEFYQEFHLLEMKYRSLFSPLYEKRSQIITGVYEPTDEECQWLLDNEEDVEEPEKKDKVDCCIGIPDFWLQVLKNSELTSVMIQKRDEPILRHLTDIRIVFPKINSMTFVVEFQFSPNHFLSNPVLRKEYGILCVKDESNPMNFDGPEMYYCKGCEINWKDGCDLTSLNSRGMRTGGNATFFNFFSPYYAPNDDNVEDERLQELLIMDFTIGLHFRGDIVQRAVSFFEKNRLSTEKKNRANCLCVEKVVEDGKFCYLQQNFSLPLTKVTPFDCIRY